MQKSEKQIPENDYVNITDTGILLINIYVYNVYIFRIYYISGLYFCRVFIKSKMKEITVSTSSLNNRGFRVLTSGLDISQYQKNPILLWMHTRPWSDNKNQILPIGIVENVRIDGDSIKGTPKFDEKDEFAVSIKNKYEDGIIRMSSIGINVVETSVDPAHLLPGQTRATVTKSKLFEVSLVDIGENDDAIQLYYQGKMINLAAGDSESYLPVIVETDAFKETLSQNQNQNKEYSMKLIAVTLGLAESATETEILAKIQELQSQAGESTTLAAEIETIRNAEIDREVQLAVTSKRITADKKDHFVELGKKSGIEVLRATLSMIPAAQKPNDIINHSATPGTTDFKKLSEVPAEKREQLRSETPDEYQKLYKAEYGVDCKI